MKRKFPKAQASEGTQREVYTVERLNQAARALLESEFPQVWVEGEISNLSTPGSGHVYFTLKDESAQIRCAWFRRRRALLDYTPSDGDHVLVRARLTMYELRGDAQLVVQYVEPAGEGALRIRFEHLKKSLQSEGLFDASRKTQLPEIPGRVGVITSPDGAAIRDVITTCRRRFPAVPIVIYPTPVQGDRAVDGVVRALDLAQQRSECDVLILARGGGSLEDLWAFNEERVARAISECTIPVVTGIGHETDYSIADFVADQRAPTPTASAEMTVPDASLLLRRIDAVRARLHTAVSARMEKESQRVDICSHRLVHPDRYFPQARHRFEILFQQLDSALHRALVSKSQVLAARSQSLHRHSPHYRLQNASWRLRAVQPRIASVAKRITDPMRQRLGRSESRLNTVNPLATLERGYALVTDESGQVVTDSRRVDIDASVDVRLAHGQLICRVVKVRI